MLANIEKYLSIWANTCGLEVRKVCADTWRARIINLDEGHGVQSLVWNRYKPLVAAAPTMQAALAKLDKLCVGQDE